MRTASSSMSVTQTAMASTADLVVSAPLSCLAGVVLVCTYAIADEHLLIDDTDEEGTAE